MQDLLVSVQSSDSRHCCIQFRDLLCPPAWKSQCVRLLQVGFSHIPGSVLVLLGAQSKPGAREISGSLLWRGIHIPNLPCNSRGVCETLMCFQKLTVRVWISAVY